MSAENFKSFEAENSSPLETFFRKMDPEHQIIIENDFFNSGDSIPLENALSAITDLNEARTVMNHFSQYIKDREFLSQEQRKHRALEINEYIDRRL